MKAKLLATLLAGLCLIFAWQAVNIGWASLISVRAEHAIAAWEDEKNDFNLAEAKLFQQRLESAISHSPHNAFHKLWLARLHILMAQHELPENHLIRAAKHLNDMIDQIPTWYESWAYLAKVQIVQKLPFDDINRSLNQALILGPYEDSNQKLLIPIVLGHWQQLTADNQQQARVLLAHALRYGKHALLTLEIARDTNSLFVIKDLIQHKWQLKRFAKFKKDLAN